MKALKELFLEKLHLDDTKVEDKNTCFKTSEEVANFLKDNIEGAKVKKVLDHGYSSASFKNHDSTSILFLTNIPSGINLNPFD